MFEKISGEAEDLVSWQTLAETTLRLDPKSTSWLRDDDLFRFLRDESGRAVGKRLSDAAGKGLW